jgi:hypothetical protein
LNSLHSVFAPISRKILRGNTLLTVMAGFHGQRVIVLSQSERTSERFFRRLCTYRMQLLALQLLPWLMMQSSTLLPVFHLTGEFIRKVMIDEQIPVLQHNPVQ